MKKIIVLVLFLGFVSFGPHASAAVCGNPALNHPEIVDPVTFAVTPAVDNVNCSNGNPELTVNVWGTMNSQLPNHKSGTSFTSISGRSEYCPAWFGLMNCVDITGTQYWKDRWGK